VSENFVYPQEVFGEHFQPPCSPTEEILLKKSRGLFTAGEDNLVFRGVNLYGEKQWNLISDRYLPERSVNMISQRYSKLCFMLYKAHGVKIDDSGNLVEPPKFESIDDVDEALLATLHQVPPPAILNVHRWSLEEDLVLLKAVSIMGSMWAELRARFIPHRDRGHLRKRYQVLERRVKATATRVSKHERNLEDKLKSNLSMNSHANVAVRRLEAQKGPSAKATTTSGASAAAGKGPTSIGPKASASSTTNTFMPNRAKSARAKLPAESNKPTDPLPRTPVTQNSKKPSPTQTAREAVPTSAATPAPQVASPYYYPPAYLYQPPPGYHPHMAYHYYPPPPYYPPGYGDVSSRHAYEQLVHDPTGEWSQMSSMRKMMENETESMVASTIVTQLARSPSKFPAASQRYSESASRPPDGKAAHSSSKQASKSTKVRHSQRLGAQNSVSTPAHGHNSASPGTPMDRPSPALKLDYSPHGAFYASGSRSAFPDENSHLAYQHSQFAHSGSMMDVYDLNGVFSNAASEGKTEIPHESNSATSTSQNAFHDGALLLENDMEAVSALNLLKSPSKSAAPDSVARRTSPRKSTQKKSLFARVVGDAAEKEVSRKRRKINR
jgi:Myb-like DNA-binding domain